MLVFKTITFLYNVCVKYIQMLEDFENLWNTNIAKVTGNVNNGTVG